MSHTAQDTPTGSAHSGKANASGNNASGSSSASNSSGLATAGSSVATTAKTQPGPLVKTAGALVWRERDRGLEVQLVHRPHYDDWSWPKGKLDTGEALQTAAIRELAEETRKPVILGQPLPGSSYLLDNGTPKTVAYWVARRATRKTDLGPLMARSTVEFAQASEIDRAKWFTVTEAASQLTNPANQPPLDALVQAHRKGYLKTHAVVIARHGKALPRATWYDEEANRPLTPIGYAHAAALIPLLAAYGVSRAVSSRWERCAATVEPYIRAANLRPWFSDNLTEASHERSPARVAATVRQLLDSGVSSVLCTHRPVLPTVFDVISQHSSRAVANQLPSDDPFLQPGEAIVAHIALTGKGPRVIAVEHLQPELY